MFRELIIGVCFLECSAPAVFYDTPIDFEMCKATCADFPPQQDLADLVNFLAEIKALKYQGMKNTTYG